jgi:predicted lipid-binding transport protein (Tim44 family)
VQLDILIFAAVAAFLIYRLNSVLGTRNGSERQRPNPFTAAEQAQRQKKGEDTPAIPTAALPPAPALNLSSLGDIIDAQANSDGRIEHGINDIRSADPFFDVASFVEGARYAFEIVVTAYARGDLAAIQPLVSPKLYGDFAAGVKARDAAGHRTELTIHRIKNARITDAHLGGTMAYVTVDFEVDETSVTRDSSGQTVDGNADSILTIRDVWTFTRDTRTTDPNWILIETRAAEQ